jgi:tRNA modification GTPase
VPLNIETESELVAEEFRAAATALGRITGHVDIEDVLDHVFSRFCIGK